MKRIGTVCVTVIGICVVAGIIGFLFFNKRLTQSKELKELSGQVAQNTNPHQILPATMGAVEHGLKLEIISPSNNARVTAPSITLRGKTISGAEVFVNEKELVADQNGNFSVEMLLDEGNNIIMVVANDKDGKAGEQDITVVYDMPM